MSDANFPPSTATTVRRAARPVVDCSGDKLLTVQSAKESCDINRIVKSFYQDGAIPEYKQGVYLDVTQFEDYRASLDRGIALQSYFDSLPSRMRERYKNDPAVFLEEIGLPQNREDAEELGLVQKEVPGDQGGDAGPGPEVVPAPSPGASP